MTTAITLIDQNRRDKLKQFIDENKDKYKSLTEFAKSVGMYVSNLSPILNGEKRFTDKLATSLEEKLNLPIGYFSSEVSNGCFIPIWGHNCKVSPNDNGFSNTGKYLELKPDSIKPEHANSKSVYAILDSVEIGRDAMFQTIGSNNQLIFDSEDISLINDKIYLILFSGKLLLRRYHEVKKEKYFDSDYSNIYAKINYDNDNIVVLGRLIYSVSLQSF